MSGKGLPYGVSLRLFLDRTIYLEIGTFVEQIVTSFFFENGNFAKMVLFDFDRGQYLDNLPGSGRSVGNMVTNGSVLGHLPTNGHRMTIYIYDCIRNSRQNEKTEVNIYEKRKND